MSRLLATPWPGVVAVDVTSGRHYLRHWHTTLGIGMVAEGGHRSLSDRGQVDAVAGHMIANNPGEVHDGRPFGLPSRRWLMLYLEPHIADVLAATGRDVRITRPAFDDARVRTAFVAVWRALREWQPRQGPHRAARSEEALSRLFGALIPHYSTHGRTRTTPALAFELERTRDRLADELDAPPSLATLAAEAGVSRFALVRRFEQAYGLSPFAWQRQVRVERAHQLIASGRALADVAGQCGFADQSHLTRAFSRHFGYTPGAWSRLHRRRLTASQ